MIKPAIAREIIVEIDYLLPSIVHESLIQLHLSAGKQHFGNEPPNVQNLMLLYLELRLTSRTRHISHDRRNLCCFSTMLKSYDFPAHVLVLSLIY